MSWKTDWLLLAAEISGMERMGELYFGSIGQCPDAGAMSGVLVPHSMELYSRIETFVSTHQRTLPPLATERLHKWCQEYRWHFSDEGLSAGTSGKVQHRVLSLASLRVAMGHLLSDFDAQAKSLTERAFLHLQRSLVVDESLRGRWGAAFRRGEIECEKLGAVHLLQHGIWAFKVSGEGERTDLVLQQPLSDLGTVETIAEALVLTEWKLVRNDSAKEAVALDARKQASRYGRGILASAELASHRYVVLVSDDLVEPPADRLEAGVTYRHVNIAVAPSVPSRRERRNETRH